jgi:hypothetical protein
MVVMQLLLAQAAVVLVMFQLQATAATAKPAW